MYDKKIHDDKGVLKSRLNEDSSNLLGLLRVQTLSTLDLLSVLEDNNGWEFGELKVLLGSWELLNVNLEGLGVVSVALGSPAVDVSLTSQVSLCNWDLLFGLRWDYTGVGVDKDILLLGGESLLEGFLAEKLLVGWDWLLNLNGGHND